MPALLTLVRHFRDGYSHVRDDGSCAPNMRHVVIDLNGEEVHRGPEWTVAVWALEHGYA